MRIRIAPTPSGFLHIGNLINFQLSELYSQHINLELGLRIDDIDSARFRIAYLEDIFSKIAMLGIKPKFGPANSEEFLKTHSQLTRLLIYKQALEKIAAETNQVFVCGCSRTEMVKKRCVKNCKSHNYTFIQGLHVIRFESNFADEVLWRREGIPSYLLTDFVDDLESEITHIVRGIDLFEPTQVQIELRKATGNAIPKYIFHPLITKSGIKLSKSNGTKMLGLSVEHLQMIMGLADQLYAETVDQLTNPIESGQILDPIEID